MGHGRAMTVAGAMLAQRYGGAAPLEVLPVNDVLSLLCRHRSVRSAPRELSDLLRLPSGVFPVVGVAIGRPDPHDRAGIKPRLPQSVVRHRERYRTAEPAEIERYDAAVQDHYQLQGDRRGWVPEARRHLASIPIQLRCSKRSGATCAVTTRSAH